jgi:hypothetical protein
VLAGEFEGKGDVHGVTGEGDARGELLERGGAVEAVGNDIFALGQHAVRTESGEERSEERIHGRSEIKTLRMAAGESGDAAR